MYVYLQCKELTICAVGSIVPCRTRGAGGFVVIVGRIELQSNVGGAARIPRNAHAGCPAITPHATSTRAIPNNNNKKKSSRNSNNINIRRRNSNKREGTIQ